LARGRRRRLGEGEVAARGAKFFQAFCQVFCKFLLVLSSFSKDYFGGFVGFQGVMRRASPF
jgi:hypothetical protein